MLASFFDYVLVGNSNRIAACAADVIILGNYLYTVYELVVLVFKRFGLFSDYYVCVKLYLVTTRVNSQVECHTEVPIFDLRFSR